MLFGFRSCFLSLSFRLKALAARALLSVLLSSSICLSWQRAGARSHSLSFAIFSLVVSGQGARGNRAARGEGEFVAFMVVFATVYPRSSGGVSRVPLVVVAQVCVWRFYLSLILVASPGRGPMLLLSVYFGAVPVVVLCAVIVSLLPPLG